MIYRGSFARFMKIDYLTTFPDIFDSYLNESMMMQAQNKGLFSFRAINLRDFAHDAHKTTDDAPYGGGDGQVMKCEPIFEAIDATYGENKPYIVIPCPQGKKFSDEIAIRLSGLEHICFICGHYEGIDERVYSVCDETISIGDYVLTSGELSSIVITDAIVRKIPGVLGADTGVVNESFANPLIEYAQYTRPSSYRGLDVPEVLLSGNDAKIAEFRRYDSIKRTWQARPDLIEKCIMQGLFSTSDLEMLEDIKKSCK